VSPLLVSEGRAKAFTHEEKSVVAYALSTSAERSRNCISALNVVSRANYMHRVFWSNAVHDAENIG
jgi:hypothetical protein